MAGKRIAVLSSAVVIFAVVRLLAAEDDKTPVVSLAGTWSFRLDAEDKGIGEKWYDAALAERIKLPGTTDEAGFGTKKTEPVVHWLNRVYEYVGPAWYQREVEIPKDWAGKRVVLFLERCHWETQVWVDGQHAGMQDSLCTPHEYDLTKLLAPGKHKLTIRVDNRMKINVGKDAHSIADHTQTNWNGIVGRIELRATPLIWIEDVQVYPNVKEKKAKVIVTIGAKEQAVCLLEVQAEFSVSKDEVMEVVSPSVPVEVPGDRPRSYEHILDFGNDAMPWDEFSQETCSVDVRVLANPIKGRALNVFELHRRVKFGLREFKTDGTQFTINGRPTFLRGTLECCIFPKTGYPPCDVEEWRRICRIAKSYGLNHLRFHSYCPPEAAFTAADEEGIYLHVETPVWTTLGSDPKVDAFIFAEADRIMKCYGNHPSFVMLCVGNEPNGPNHPAFLSKIVASWKEKDPRRVYTGCSGWPVTPEADYHSRPQPRGHAWGAGLKSRFNAKPLSTEVDYSVEVARFKVPVVSHEIGQWCVYPNFDEIAKYTGVVRARNFEVFRESLDKHHMLDQAKDFLLASGKWQAHLYKEEIEASLRTKGFGGFQLLDLHDFPGQGTALVGVLDPFWDDKGYITAAEHRRYCSETVPLVRLPKVVWTSNEELAGSIEVAHYGAQPIRRATLVWQLKDAEGNPRAGTEIGNVDIPLGSGHELSQFRTTLAGIKSPQRLTLEVAIKDTPFRNSWNVWVYPEKVDTDAPTNVTVVEKLDDALPALKNGGRVVLLAPPATVKSDVPPGFTTIFWNTQWTKRQPPHTLGLLCDPSHVALKAFPTEFHTNWQWFDLVSRSRAMILDDLPPALRPIVQVIDDWNTNRKLGLVFEAEVGGGKLLVCSIDLSNGLTDRPVARQMRHSLLQYAGGEAFAPKHKVDTETLRKLFRAAAPESDAKLLKVDSAAEGYEGENVLDGDPETIWHTPWGDGAPGFPHELVIELKARRNIAGLRYVPRQDLANGRIAEYEVYVSDDGKTWGTPAAKGKCDNNGQEKQIRFAAPQAGRYVRFVALGEVRGQRFAAVAELEVLDK